MKRINVIPTLICFLLTAAVLISCTEDSVEESSSADNFDREAMLINWADHMIIPAYSHFEQQTAALQTATEQFTASPSSRGLTQVRDRWEAAYLAWQQVSLYNVGPAQRVFLRNFVNIYPTNRTAIDANIASGQYALQDINRDDEQGFPALDYLLFGLGDTDDAILSHYTTHANASAHLDYLTALTDRIHALSNEVLIEWQNGYRDQFVNNSGNTATSSTNVLVNEYVKYYEVFFRNGKVGTPAGVFSAGATQPQRVEAFYYKELTKALTLSALDALQHFFNGQGFADPISRASLGDYLDFLNTMKNGEDLTALINGQFDSSRIAIDGLQDDFYTQINTDNALMLQAFEELQANVVLLKSDMMSALSINIAFESNDGD